MARQRSRWALWFAGLVGSTVLVALVAVTLVRPPGPERVDAAPTPPPPPPAVLGIAAAGAPVPTVEGVRAALDELAGAPQLGRVGAAVVDAATGQVLYGRGPDTALVPASTLKLLTAAAVLATRGPAYRIPTVVVAGAAPGEVVLVGGGDPTLAIDDKGTYPGAGRLDLLAEQVQAAGPRITRVVVDAGGFTGAVHGPWDADIPGGGFVGPVTALMTDGGRVDPRQGAPAMRWDQPDLAAGEAFAALLGAGEVVRGTAPPPPAATGPASGAAAPGTELGRVYSPPVIRLVEIMLVDSDNVVAESLARQVALARGEPASYQGAAAAMTAVLAELGLPVSDIVLSDGSGLSRGNRVTPALLAGLLAAAVSRPELAGLFAGLPVAGWSGTLAERYRTPQPETTPGAGVVRAKTGSLRGISALAGVVVTADGRLLTFALLANDASATAPDQLDRIAAKLATCGCA